MTDSAKVSVVVPVGPFAVYKRWLGQCLESVWVQTYPADEVVVVDDMANVTMADTGGFADELYWGATRPESGVILKDGKPLGKVWRTPWRLGHAAAFNCGVGLARNDLVFLLSCDDTMEPQCLELCVAEWEKQERRDAFYYVGAHIIGCEGETVAPDQNCPFGNAMVTKDLWRMTGGFRIFEGPSDLDFLTQVLGDFQNRCLPVAKTMPLYNARSHDESITRARASQAPARGPADWGRLS
jgi:glycosyltransferase involved in cell wall biosynthesis